MHKSGHSVKIRNIFYQSGLTILNCPEFQNTVGYLDLRVDTVESIVNLLEQKLKKNPGRGLR